MRRRIGFDATSHRLDEAPIPAGYVTTLDEAVQRRDEWPTRTSPPPPLV
jgi:hypothetical protein